MANGSVRADSISNVFDGKRSSANQKSEESDGWRLWPLIVRCIVNGSGELVMRWRFAKEAPALSGEDFWSKRYAFLPDFTTELDDAGVATAVAFDKGDDWISGKGLAVIVLPPLRSGVPWDLASTVKDRLQLLE